MATTSGVGDLLGGYRGEIVTNPAAPNDPPVTSDSYALGGEAASVGR
jgi:hypothetical protein